MQDELIWGAAWLFKATKAAYYWNYVTKNINKIQNSAEFGWDTKDAGINVLISKVFSFLKFIRVDKNIKN